MVDEAINSPDEEFARMPWGTLERQLFISAIGDCTGLTILDLGGGSGLRARDVTRAGAVAVDVVDRCLEYMKLGEEVEQSLGRSHMRWFEGDCAQSLSHLPLAESYDMVLACWLFDYAENMEQLEGMWKNISTYLKPGGRFVCVRACDPSYLPSMPDKYGVAFRNFVDIPGGVKYEFAFPVLADAHTTGQVPQVPFVYSMEKSYSGSTELPEKYGLKDVQVESYQNAACARQDPAFWQHFLDKPGFAVVKAVK